MSVLPEAAEDRGVSRRIVEVVTALLLMALAGLVLWDSYGRGAGWQDGPEGGFFPARVGWLLLFSAAFVVISTLRRPDSVFVTYAQLRQVMRVFVPLVLYIIAIAIFGIYVASALFLALFMVTLGSFRWWSVALASVLVPLVTFWVFELQFRVPLPKGPLEAALGY
jgi:putative tricarboxylic transport membrane protein